MNRYIDRYMLIFASFFLFSGEAYSQIKLEAPETVASGKKIVLKVDPGTTKDIKYTVLKDGKPFSEYLGFKDLSTDKPVLLFTDTEDGVYTTVASGVLNGKTDVAIVVVSVGKPKPIPGPPKPDDPPQPAGFGKELRETYQKTPDPDTLELLIQVFADVKATVATDKYKSFGDFETSIAATAADRLKKDQTKLRAVRDRIGDYLVEKTGPDPRAWNKAKATQVCDDVLAALKGCK
jgi:hypothetical protein